MLEVPTTPPASVIARAMMKSAPMLVPATLNLRAASEASSRSHPGSRSSLREDLAGEQGRDAPVTCDACRASLVPAAEFRCRSARSSLRERFQGEGSAELSFAGRWPHQERRHHRGECEDTRTVKASVTHANLLRSVGSRSTVARPIPGFGERAVYLRRLRRESVPLSVTHLHGTATSAENNRQTQNSRRDFTGLEVRHLPTRRPVDFRNWSALTPAGRPACRRGRAGRTLSGDERADGRRRDLRGGDRRRRRRVPPRGAARRDRRRPGGRTPAALPHQRQVDRVLPQLVAGPRRRHGGADEPVHRPPRGARARERQRVPDESPRLSLRHRRRRACPTFVRAAEEAAARGVGPARMHASPEATTAPRPPTASKTSRRARNVITDRTLVRRHFPYLAEDTVALLHARRCGWFSGQQLGMYLLERAREKGVRLVEGRVERVEVAGGRVRGVTAETRGGRAHVLDPALRERGGPVRPAGQSAHRRRAPGVLRASREGSPSTTCSVWCRARRR